MDALGNRTTYNYDSGNRLESVMDPRNNLWTNIYDARDLVAQMDPLGTGARVCSMRSEDGMRHQPAGV